MTDSRLMSQPTTNSVSTEDMLSPQLLRQPYVAPTVEKLGVSATEFGAGPGGDGSFSS